MKHLSQLKKFHNRYEIQKYRERLFFHTSYHRLLGAIQQALVDYLFYIQ